MSVSDLSIGLENVVHALGFEDVKAFVVEQSKNLLVKKIKTCDSNISFFKAKYGCNYESFLVEFHNINQFDLFEKEDDGMAWSSQVELREYYINLLKNITE